ncbi:RICIN domain-containing protein [Actinomadura sp. 9N215]|uniref:RICIN domain-containing protein n=1 Tax=Actinomadura sp. 9N215 TaxID=3375150 RepID=UPI00379D0398
MRAIRVLGAALTAGAALGASVPGTATASGAPHPAPGAAERTVTVPSPVVTDPRTGAKSSDLAADARPPWTRLRVQHSKKCLEIPGWSKKSGTRADQYTCVKQANAQWALWLIQSTGSGTTRHYIYAVQNRHSGLCLTVEGVKNGGAVRQRQCRNAKYGDNYRPQLFWYTPLRQLVSRHARKCLDISGASKRNGALTTVWTCKAGKMNQRFANIR